MLPKVANHLLQHTSRAVTAVQPQTLRNVLQLQSSPSNNLVGWNGSTSSSGWNGSGTGAGGAKFHSSRFNGNYSSLGRGVTLADPSCLSGPRGELADDSDDVPAVSVETRSSPAHSRRRIRSSSLSFTIQDAEPQRGILKAIRQHVRSRHAFAQLESQRPASRSSSQRRQELDAPERDENPLSPASIMWRMREAAKNRNRAAVDKEVQYLYSSSVPLSTDLFNAALRTLRETRPWGALCKASLALFRHMSASSIQPDSTTYITLIMTLLERTIELSNGFENRKLFPNVLHSPPQANIFLSFPQGKSRALDFGKRTLSTAVGIFQNARQDSSISLPPFLYEKMLKSCLRYHDLEAATLIFSHGRSQGVLQTTGSWSNYLILIAESGDLSRAEEMFSSFREVAKAAPHEYECPSIWGDMMYIYICHGQPEKALALLEKMLDSGSDDIPSPSPATFSRIIRAFGEIGDTQSALAWFDRLLSQMEPCTDPHISSREPTKPAPDAWVSIICHLARDGMFQDVDRLLRLGRTENLYHPTVYTTTSVLSSYLQSSSETLTAGDVTRLDSLLSHLFASSSDVTHVLKGIRPFLFARMCRLIFERYNACGRPDRGLQVVHDTLITPAMNYAIHNTRLDHHLQPLADCLRGVINVIVTLLSTTTSASWSIVQAAHMAQLSALLDTSPSSPAASHLLSMYARSTPAEKDLLTVSDWETLFMCYTSASEQTRMTMKALDVFQDGISRGVRIGNLRQQTVDSIVDFLQANYRGPQQLAIAAQLGISDMLRRDSDTETLSSGERDSARTSSSSSVAHRSHSNSPMTLVSLPLNDELNESARNLPRDTPDQVLRVYQQFEAGLRSGLYPSAVSIGRLINAVGRLGHLDKVKTLYNTAQDVLAAMVDDKPALSLSWFQVEDQMIIALAHAGDVDAAHVHRQRILQQGGSPSPDAYGILIQNIKDTTDDNTNALALFKEAIDHGVTPNVYLYNIIISKLAKARKADTALELFRQMKAQSVVPTSVTYGALIAACGRVGDVTSAENLFKEMSSKRNFRPRVPPYNMMMQLYTQTKPDRERALYYYNAMLDARIQPTAHTYKLLMDTYGTVEPADIGAMEAVFEQLLADSSVTVNGAHWASLIHAYGCVQKDLDKALSVFDSIKDHPSTRHSSRPLPDAVVYEALINVFNTVRRTELVSQYHAKIQECGIHMTAYIANVLIKGYSLNGDIDRARALFESLLDPPEGVAAPNNHAPHDSEQAISVPVDAPVYREPSTWEAMLRAELGSGSRHEAMALLERMKLRRFPVAVFNRISGIMLDESASPWEGYRVG